MVLIITMHSIAEIICGKKGHRCIETRFVLFEALAWIQRFALVRVLLHKQLPVVMADTVSF